MLAAERGSLSSSFGVQVAAHGGCNEQDQSSWTGTSLPQHLLPQLRPQNRGSSAQRSLVRANGSGRRLAGRKDGDFSGSTGPQRVNRGCLRSPSSLHIPTANRAGIPSAAEPRAVVGLGQWVQQLVSYGD